MSKKVTVNPLQKNIDVALAILVVIIAGSIIAALFMYFATN
ncbi:MAG: hypothetical protein WCL07_02355 [bacterium]